MSKEIIAQTEQEVSLKREPFFREELTGKFQPGGLLFAVMVGLSKNKSYSKWRPWLIDSVNELIRDMRECLAEEQWVQELEAQYQHEAIPGVVTRVLISFWASVFDSTVQEICRVLNEQEDSGLRRALGLKWGKQCHPQRISEFHQAIGGVEGKKEMQVYLRDRVCEMIQLEQLTEADVEWAAVEQRRLAPAALRPMGQGEAWARGRQLARRDWIKM